MDSNNNYQQSQQQYQPQQPYQQTYQQQPYQQPYAPQQQAPNAPVGLAVASMVLGILSLVLSCCVPYIPFILALLAVIFGGVSLSKKMGGKGMAIAGLVCGIISLIPAIVVVLMGGAIWASML